MSRRGLGALAATVLLALVGCGSDGATREAERNGGELVHLPDGTSVMCVFNANHGVTCDWSRRGQEKR